MAGGHEAPYKRFRVQFNSAGVYQIFMNQQNQIQQEMHVTWAAAFKEFFSQLGTVTVWLIIVLSFGQCTNCVDIYRLLGR